MTTTFVAPARLALIGLGSRGQEVYGRYCLAHPNLGKVVAVVDTDATRLRAVAADHGLRDAATFTKWSDLFAAQLDLDGVVVATPDRAHVDPVLAAVDHRLPVLVEKPLAPNLGELRRLERGIGNTPSLITVAHVLRYTPFFERIRKLLDDGAIGSLTTIDYMEHIGYWHFAHSYVRGNWRNETLASPMILAKAVHDLDLLRWFAGASWDSVSSVGALHHFHAGNRPTGAPDYCIEGCPVAASCPFDATRIYDPTHPIAGPLAVKTAVRGWASWDDALRQGPYGRCVYGCDNDVLDHQIVQVEFENGVLASLTVTAFTAEITRTVHFLGTHGELWGDLLSGRIELTSFHPSGTHHSEVIRPKSGHSRPYDTFLGHAGGDEGLMRAFLPSLVRHRIRRHDFVSRTGFAEAFDSHEMAFAAEESRRTGRAIRPADLENITSAEP
jgi:predicted dehydrogenase